MRIFPGRIALAVACLCVTALPVHAADSFSPITSGYATAGLAAGNMPVPVSDHATAPSLSLEDAASAPATTQSYWPLLYSTLVPGLGELTMGYEKRGIALMAAEAVAWAGYFKNHSDGMHEREAYEAYADAHWTESRWVAEFPDLNATTVEEIEEYGQAQSGSGKWPGYIPYIPKDVDKQHYYENLGKYDWYISGWDDWKGLVGSDYAKQTDNRTTYRSMRQQSNNSLDDADAFLWISFAARAFSIAETAIIIHGRRNDAGGGGEGSPVSLRARPRGYTGGEVALEVRFK